jgi:hypothetical protein
MSPSVAPIGVRLTPVLVRRSGGNVSVPAVKEMERHEDAVDLRSFQSSTRSPPRQAESGMMQWGMPLRALASRSVM